ncbi:MAG: response regulator [Candidatus Symbiothrix sp.]|jgi:signal transduction histidine kinase/ligand-binding sensor domain-containing protein/AraC-like DNA-binding protein/AmiR/NasT family two-component response regulator|nr:response regulator [Candidatus Symbiothrix sp.]
MYKFFIIFPTFVLGLCLSSLSASAQSYSIRRIGIEQGLSNNYIVSITQDKQGFLWFATESGLNRFDGKSFRVYKKSFEGKPGISANELNKVYADPIDNIIWIATQRAGLNVYDCETESFSLFLHKPENHNSIASDAVTDIANDAAGNLWIATYSNGVDYYDKTTRQFVHFNRTTLPELPSDYVWTIADDRKGRLYIGHVNDGLSVLNLNDRSVKNYTHQPDNPFSLPNNNVRTIFIDNLGNIWVGSDGGLALFNPDTEQFVCFKTDGRKTGSLISNVVFSIMQTNDNQLWIGTENGGVSILNLNNKMFLSPKEITFQNIYPSDGETGLSYSTVRTVFQDNFGNVWIGTYSGGINFINKNPDFFHKWQHSLHDQTNSLPSQTAWGICEDNAGAIWIGTNGGGICTYYNGLRTAVYTKENRQLSDNYILSALKDSDGNLWFGTYEGGIIIYDSRKKQFSDFRSADFNIKTIRCFFEDQYKTIWIGSDNEGMFSYHLPSKMLKKYTAKIHNLPSDNNIRAIAKDAQGRLWVGSFGVGLCILDSMFNSIAEFHREAGFYSNAVSCIFKDSRQRMWVGTSEGLILFPNTENLSDFIIFTEKNGLKNSYIRAVIEDSEGKIWFSSNDGIASYDETKNKFYNYDYSHGLPAGQFMDGSTLRASNGYLYFGSQNGVCRFNPKEITNRRALPPVSIIGFRYYTGRTEPETTEGDYPVSSGTAQLKYNQNTFTLTFNVMDYAFANQIEYAYQMKGLNDEWYEIGKTNEVVFRNLPSGTYLFSVRSRLNNQDWSEQTASFNVKIHPPLYWTWWAKLIYILIVIAIILYIASFYKKRIQLESQLYMEKENIRQQQVLNNDKLQFFTNITHELRTPLTLIIGPLEDLSNDASLSEQSEKKISLIYKNASRLLDLINRILDFRKTETNNLPLRVSKGDIAKLMQEIVLKYKELNRNSELLFTLSVETGNTVLFFDPEIVSMILDNLLSNAFKYTRQGEIRVSLRDITENELAYTEIEVSDTGCGIPASELEKIFDRYYQVKGKNQASGTGVGLSLVKNLAAVHQGVILVESEEERGSVFRFRLMTDKAYPGVPHDPGALHARPLPDTGEIEEANNKKIMLIVEDNSDILHYIRDIFAGNYAILTAKDGKAGLEYAFDHIPDIVISDIMMPELSGLELCVALKNDIRTSHIPVILLTAKTSMQDKTEGYQVGADSYITKPFSADLLRSRVANLMDSRKKLAEQMVHSKVFKQTLLNNSIHQLDNEFLEKVGGIIKDNCFSEDLDIEFIAQKVNMSHATLYRKIKALTSLSVNEFIRKIRMKQAEELLLTGKYTISEVAFRVGINSITYFRQCFKDEFGVSASEHIKRIQER